jgi:hypothetical protein
MDSVEFPPLTLNQSVQAWMQCIAVPADASQPFSGRPRRYSKARNAVRAEPAASRTPGRGHRGSERPMVDQGCFELDVVGCSFGGRKADHPPTERWGRVPARCRCATASPPRARCIPSREPERPRVALLHSGGGWWRPRRRTGAAHRPHELQGLGRWSPDARRSC